MLFKACLHASSHHTRPGKDDSYRYGKEHSVSTNGIPSNVQEVVTYAVLPLHYSNCERHHYPHIPEPGISELEHALEIALNRPSLEFPLQYSKTRGCLDHILQLLFELQVSTDT